MLNDPAQRDVLNDPAQRDVLNNPTRRDVLRTGGLLLASVASGAAASVATGAVASTRTTFDIAMRSDTDGAQVWFDPIGLLVPLNSTIRWRIHENVHTATAYHPENDSHSLRIPKEAAPWDSDYLVNPGDAFEVTLRVPGVYDYYCAPHEIGGMVGRIIVQEAHGPGTLAFDYFKDQHPDWQEVPELARAAFPSIQSILKNGAVHL